MVLRSSSAQQMECAWFWSSKVTCRHGDDKAPGQPGVDDHHGVVGPPVLVAGIGVQDIQLAP